MTVSKIIAQKGKSKITMLTAYDTLMARLLEEAGMDIILVGDTLGNVVLGYDTTLPVTIEDIIRHTQAVRRGAPKSLVIADMPFLSYGVGISESVSNAGRIMKETGANGVKLEGGTELCDHIRAMTDIGIPVIGHIGLKPQSYNKSGYRIAGKTKEDTEKMVLDAVALEKAGVFSMVLEGTTVEAASEVTRAVSVPTIGIGAGNGTDGQVLVITDMLGLDQSREIKHNKRYADLRGIILEAVGNYIREVRSGTFPEEKNSFHKD